VLAGTDLIFGLFCFPLISSPSNLRSLSIVCVNVGCVHSSVPSGFLSSLFPSSLITLFDPQS
jgi:hypothetical protein